MYCHHTYSRLIACTTQLDLTYRTLQFRYRVLLLIVRYIGYRSCMCMYSIALEALLGYSIKCLLSTCINTQFTRFLGIHKEDRVIIFYPCLSIGSIVLLALAVLSSLFQYIPSASLAAIIIAAVIPVIDVRILWAIFKVNGWSCIHMYELTHRSHGTLYMYMQSLTSFPWWFHFL